MRSSTRLLASLATSLSILPLAACSIPTIGATEAKKTAETIGHVKPSKKDTCETQVQVAAQSSKIDTIVKGQETVYKADCAETKVPQATAPAPAPAEAKKTPAKAQPKTSS